MISGGGGLTLCRDAPGRRFAADPRRLRHRLRATLPWKPAPTRSCRSRCSPSSSSPPCATCWVPAPTSVEGATRDERPTIQRLRAPGFDPRRRASAARHHRDHRPAGNRARRSSPSSTCSATPVPLNLPSTSRRCPSRWRSSCGTGSPSNSSTARLWAARVLYEDLGQLLNNDGLPGVLEPDRRTCSSSGTPRTDGHRQFQGPARLRARRGSLPPFPARPRRPALGHADQLRSGSASTTTPTLPAHRNSPSPTPSCR